MADPYSYRKTTGSPGQTTVAVPFPYISQAHVHVSLDEVQVSDSLLVWNSPSLITLPSTLTGGEAIKVWRETPAAVLSATFGPGPILSSDLNKVLLQQLYVAQETRDLEDDTVLDQVQSIYDQMLELYAAVAAAAGGVLFPTYASVADYHPTTAPLAVQTQGFYAEGDGGGAIYQQVEAEPTHGAKVSITQEDAEVVWYELTALPTRNVRQVGAKLDGTTVDDAAWDIVAAVGGLWWHPGGTSIVATPIDLLLPGTQLYGIGAGYDNSLTTGSTIKASADFAGDHIVAYGDGSDNMRTVGMRDIEINGGSASDAHGLVVWQGYDSCIFENITVLKIGNGRHCFFFTAPEDDVGQTITGTNLFGIHRNDNNSAAAFRFYRQQECVFTNCKGWGAGSTAGATNSTADVFDVDSCSSMTFITPSAVATKEHGFLIHNTVREGTNITLISPLFENVGKPLKVSSEAAFMFASGGLSPVPSVGDVVKQPSDGSTATGVVWFATSAGAYVKVTSGTFALGVLYDNAGVSIGTITTLNRRAPRTVKLINPNFKGSVAGVSGESTITNAAEFEMEWLSNHGTVPPLTVTGAESSGLVRTPDRTKITMSGDYRKVTVQDYHLDMDIFATDWYALNASGIVTLPTPKKGDRVRFTHDISEATVASFQIAPGSGVSIDRGNANTNLFVSGLGSSVTLRAVSSTEWRIESFVGAISVNPHGYRMTDRGNIDINASISIGTQTFGYRYTNNDATAIRTLTMLAIGTTSPLLTNGGYRFTRTNATYALRIDCNAADQIVGSTGVGKYLQIDTVGATVEIRCINGKWHVFGDAASYSFEP